MKKEQPIPEAQQKKPSGPNIFGLLKPYRNLIVLLVLFSLLSNALTLWLPKLISHGIDSFIEQNFALQGFLITFFGAIFGILVFSLLQAVMQTYASERVARDLRHQLSTKISLQSYMDVQSLTPSKLLTNLTSDIDAIKGFVSQAVVSIVSSIFLIGGASVLLLTVNWRLGLAVLTIVPMIAGTFAFVFARVRVLFMKAQGIIDRLNKVINESILGSALIRVLYSQEQERSKFVVANTDARETGLSILRLFASMIPVITFLASLATLIILALGGHFVIRGTMTLGSFAAFNSYVGILIFPIFVLGFTSNVIAQATASYTRILEVLQKNEREETGTVTQALRGDIAIKNVSVQYGEKMALRDVSFSVKAGTRNAIIGPTAAGKSQLLHLLTALIEPTSGSIEYDGREVREYNKKALHGQIGFVFQDSVLFNLTIRENIAFSTTVKDEDLKKAIDTAELQEFIDSLPQGLDTVVSERGTSLSGGQKQRVMLARALAINPKILFLDDFTARVDTETERKILANVRKNYPDSTLVSVTQKVAAVEDYDQIILLMEGELLAKGTHEDLLKCSPEYVQIYESQRSTNHYELRAE
jgi:ATP-binding cassette subfamily B protein